MSIPTYGRATKALFRLLALEYLKDYCKKRRLSFDKLKTKRFDILGNNVIFSEPNPHFPNGLMTDLESMPTPLLYISDDGGKLQVYETDSTEHFLSEE